MQSIEGPRASSPRLADSAERHRALETAIALGERVGALLLEGYRQPFEVRKKGAIDLVTDFDLRAEALIREGLSAAFPHHRIVAEEGPSSGSGDLVWYVDPLDGTTNFAHGHPFFCTSIALYAGNDYELGVVHAPALGHRWHAARGLGAFRDGHRCAVSTTRALSESLGATGFPYDQELGKERNIVEHDAFLRRTRGVRRCGSAALDLALVADGTYDFYWEQRLNSWDLAAGAALVSEARGQTTAYDGSAFVPTDGHIVASNRALHAEVLDVLHTARAPLGKTPPRR